MDIKSVKIENPENLNMIIGQSHFIKTAEDLYEAIVNTNPNAKFGLAFCEASMHRLIRAEGNDEELKQLAIKNAMNVGAGHTFFIFMKDAFPINFLRIIRNVPEVCTVFCATANEVDVIVAENERGRGILGVIDGEKPAGVEGEEDIKERREIVRKFGYKL